MKLKGLFLIVMTSLFVFAGCNKDEFTDNGTDMNLKSADLKMIPIKGDVSFGLVITESDFENGIPVPKQGPISGTVSHLGNLKEGSLWLTDSYELYATETQFCIDYGINGKLVAANGDELVFTAVGTIFVVGNEDGLNWVGTFTFTGGTGRFKNASGEASSTGVGTRDNNGLPLTLELNLDGTISNVGQSK